MPKYKTVKIGEKPTRYGYELLLLTEGRKSWTSNGFLHREDGPAFEHKDDRNVWYILGKELNKYWFLQHPEQINKMRAWELFEPEELVRLKHETNKT